MLILVVDLMLTEQNTKTKVILLMAEILHQLRLVVFQLFIGFHTSQLVSQISAIDSSSQFPTAKSLQMKPKICSMIRRRCDGL